MWVQLSTTWNLSKYSDSHISFVHKLKVNFYCNKRMLLTQMLKSKIVFLMPPQRCIQSCLFGCYWRWLGDTSTWCPWGIRFWNCQEIIHEDQRPALPRADTFNWGLVLLFDIFVVWYLLKFNILSKVKTCQVLYATFYWKDCFGTRKFKIL